MNTPSIRQTTIFFFFLYFFTVSQIVSGQPSDEQLREIILSKTTDIIPESIKLSSTGGTIVRHLNGAVHWKRSATFIGKTDVGRKKYSVDVHTDKDDNFIRFTWGDVTYLDMDRPDFSSIEEVIQHIPNRFVDGLDGKIRAIIYIKLIEVIPDSITWSGGGKEVTLKFTVGFLTDGRYNFEERWFAEQVYSVTFFKERADDSLFIKDRLYVTNRKKRKDLELIKKLSEEEAKKERWGDNTRIVPPIQWY